MISGYAGGFPLICQRSDRAYNRLDLQLVMAAAEGLRVVALADRAWIRLRDYSSQPCFAGIDHPTGASPLEPGVAPQRHVPGACGENERLRTLDYAVIPSRLDLFG